MESFGKLTSSDQRRWNSPAMWRSQITPLTFLIVLSVSQPFSKIWHPDQDFEDQYDDLNKTLPFKEGGFHSLRRGGSKVVSNFITSLMKSEKYLKNIDVVKLKLHHLDTLVQDRTHNILKNLTEMMKFLHANPEHLKAIYKFLKKSFQDVQKQLLSLTQKQYTQQKPPQNTKLFEPVEGGLETDSMIDARLSNLENQIKSVMTGVESIVSIISEVKSRQIARTSVKSEGGQKLDSLSIINEFRKTLHDTRKRCECNRNDLRSGRVDRSERYPTDCHEIQMQGFNVSGIYKIKPEDMEPFYVLCDLITAGGGWTVIQNRFDGSQDFYKGWSDYKNGFGNLAGEFWLGLEKLNFLTNQKLYELRVEIETQHGQDAYAGYSVFTVGPEYEGFRISTLGTYYGSAGDSLSYHAGQKFSTIDADNDEWKVGQCAVEHGGAWWYKECDKSNLNGKYSTSADEHRGQSIYWISFKGPNFPLTKTKMMIRPLPASRPNDLADSSRKLPDGSSMRSEPQSLVALHKQMEAPFDMGHTEHSLYQFLDRNNAFFP